MEIAPVARRTLILVLTVLALSPMPVAPVASVAATSLASGDLNLSDLHVQANQIVNGSGQVIRLRGVNRSGTEYACVRRTGIFDGPADAASVQAMLTWHINAVRIPLNEDCWLGINGVRAAYSGSVYQQAIADYVNLLTQYGLVAILDLHWSAPGTTLADLQQPMPDRDHSVTFWEQVANRFKSNGSVVFDLFNEPYVPDAPWGWRCWRDGGTCAGVNYQTAGMQTLVSTVRQTGALNLILLSGVAFAEHLSQWLAYEPIDPAENLAASWHNETLYGQNVCGDVACWTNQVLPVAQQVPVVADEIGESDCDDAVVDTLMSWLDSHNLGYLAWTWTGGTCYFNGNIGGPSGMALIANYSGAPTAYGVAFGNHFAGLIHVSPVVIVLPSMGRGGSAAAAVGSGFGPWEPVLVYWDNPPQVLGIALADGQGRFDGPTAISFMVPWSAAPGLHIVYGVGQLTRAMADGLFVVR